MLGIMIMRSLNFNGTYFLLHPLSNLLVSSSQCKMMQILQDSKFIQDYSNSCKAYLKKRCEASNYVSVN